MSILFRKFERPFTPQTWLRSVRNLAKTRFQRLPTFIFRSQKNIKSELSKVAGLEINFEYKIDRDLIGGFKIQLGSLMIDTSIKNKLKQYEQRMLEN